MKSSRGGGLRSAFGDGIVEAGAPRAAGVPRGSRRVVGRVDGDGAAGGGSLVAGSNGTALAAVGSAGVGAGTRSRAEGWGVALRTLSVEAVGIAVLVFSSVATNATAPPMVSIATVAATQPSHAGRPRALRGFTIVSTSIWRGTNTARGTSGAVGAAAGTAAPLFFLA